MASNVQQCTGSVRVVCIQRVAKDHKHDRKSYAEGLQHGLPFLGKTYFGIQTTVQVIRKTAQVDHDRQQDIDGRAVDPAHDAVPGALFRRTCASRVEGMVKEGISIIF